MMVRDTFENAVELLPPLLFPVVIQIKPHDESIHMEIVLIAE